MVTITHIKLTQGKVAIVDKEDFDFLNQFKWHYDKVTGYAKRHIRNKSIYLHKLINNTPEGFQTDHINRNKLDNRKENLRTCSRNLNQRNQDIDKTNTSGYKGVSWSKSMKKWEAFLFKNNKKINLGYFIDKLDAVRSRLNGEQKYWNI